SSGNSPVAAFADDRGVYGIQFHPEVVHTPSGREVLRNFLFGVCHCKPSWTPGSFIAEAIESVRAQVGDGRVICALSGGVDSAVAATLVHQAVGDQLTCVFVNNGLLRKEEPDRVLDVMHGNLDMNIRYVDATERFLAALRGVIDPEQKRRIVGREFISVFEAEATSLGRIDFLAQGTLYPDVIESTAPDVAVTASKIKTHHNVGGLPPGLRFQLIEPPRYLFKDEVRAVGLELGMPQEMVYRQPFPGPGLSIRCLGEVTAERLEILRNADWVVVDEIKRNGLYRQVWQSFAVLTPLETVGVMGDYRTYANVVAVRVVTSEDAMTADWARVPYEVLARISNRIVNRSEERRVGKEGGDRWLPDFSSRRRHTRSLRDWSSDVCSSDLRQVWQSFAVLTPLETVGVMGDYRTYANVVAVRVVTSEDAMTADWARVPYEVLARISNRIVNEVKGVNRVVFDITSKPPGTIEWE